MQVQVKFCGLTDKASVKEAVESGAHYLGCVFDINSANYVSPFFAKKICSSVPQKVKKVAVVREPTREILEKIIFYFQPDYVQFHGSETPDYLLMIKAKYHCKIIKSIYVHSTHDLAQIDQYSHLVDMFLFEPTVEYLDYYQATPKFFEWRIFKTLKTDIPWIISGNISRHNLSLILRASDALIVNIDLKLESGLDQREPGTIHHFMQYFTINHGAY